MQLAELDFFEIVACKAVNFDEIQAHTYSQTQMVSIEALHDGLCVLGAKARDDIQSGIRTLHVALQQRNERRFVVSREAQNHYIDAQRLFHNSIDLASYFPATNDQPY